jgi:endonuclease/exonuclease/phosphatase (EEP) superfamily protein YafD
MRQASPSSWARLTCRLARWSLIVLVLGCVAFAVVGALGWLSEQLDLANQFAPIWTGVGLAAAAVLAAVGGRRARMASLLAAALLLFLGGQRIAPELMARAPPPVVGPARPGVLRLVSFNVWKRNQDPPATAAWILAEDPDIVVFIDAAGRGEEVATALRGRYPYAVRCDRGNCSTMLLSKRPPLRSGGLAQGDPENKQGLSAAWATYADQAGPYTVVGVHLVRPWPLGPQQAQRRQLLGAISDLPKSRMILAGDFNSTPWTFGLQEFDAAIGLPRRTRALFSWPAGFGRDLPALLPILPIDQVYAADSWRTVGVWRGPRLGSDHFPVVTWLAPSALLAPAPRAQQSVEGPVG